MQIQIKLIYREIQWKNALLRYLNLYLLKIIAEKQVIG